MSEGNALQGITSKESSFPFRCRADRVTFALPEVPSKGSFANYLGVGDVRPRVETRKEINAGIVRQAEKMGIVGISITNFHGGDRVNVNAGKRIAESIRYCTFDSTRLIRAIRKGLEKGLIYGRVTAEEAENGSSCEAKLVLIQKPRPESDSRGLLSERQMQRLANRLEQCEELSIRGFWMNRSELGLGSWYNLMLGPVPDKDRIRGLVRKIIVDFPFGLDAEGKPTIFLNIPEAPPLSVRDPKGALAQHIAAGNASELAKRDKAGQRSW